MAMMDRNNDCGAMYGKRQASRIIDHHIVRENVVRPRTSIAMKEIIQICMVIQIFLGGKSMMAQIKSGHFQVLWMMRCKPT